MVTLFRSFSLKYLCLYCTLGTFSISTLPLYSITINQINQAAFLLKMEKIVEKIKKYADRLDRKKLIEAILELKQEAEGFTGEEIDLDAAMNVVEREFKRQGGKKEDFKKFKKLFKSKAKRRDHKLTFLGNCLTNGIDYIPELEQMEFVLNCGKDFDEDGEDEVVLSARIEYGCMLMLAGVILDLTGRRLNMDPVKKLGDALFGLGIGFIADKAINQVDDNRKAGKNTKKN